MFYNLITYGVLDQSEYMQELIYIVKQTRIFTLVALTNEGRREKH